MIKGTGGGQKAMAAMMEKPRDVVSGVVVMAIGAGFLLNGLELERGSSFRMGPGYFPTLLSVLMIGLGLLITVLAIRKPATESGFGGLPWKGLALIIGATILFGFTLRGLGLAPVLAITVLATAWASRYATLRASVPLALGLAAFCAFLFIKLLGLPLPLTGPWLSASYWSPPEATSSVTIPVEEATVSSDPAATR
jgi:hypothetical protein